MADKIQIPIGGEYIDVPAWASDENLEALVKIDAGVLKSLNALLKDNRVYTRETIRSNQEALNSLQKTIDKNAKESTKTDEEQAKTLREILSFDKIKKRFAEKQAESDKNAARDLNNQLESVAKGIKDVPGKIAKGINEGNLTGIATAIGGVVGLGAAAGFLAGALEGFAKNVSSLANSGVGLTIGLDQLRGDAARAGLNLENYGKIIQGNGRAINALGEGTADGARVFSMLSQEMRHAARDVGQFGLSNTEYNEILAEEIELRRLSGMSQDQITRSVAGSMNELLTETTALAAITGQDRREIQRNRLELMNNEVIVNAREQLEAMGREMPGAFTSLTGILGGLGDIGATLQVAIGESAATGVPMQATAAYRAIAEQLSAAGLADEAQELADFFKVAYDTDMPVDQVNQGLLEIAGRMRDGAVDSDTLAQQAAILGDSAQRQILGFLQSIEGLPTTAEEIERISRETQQGLKDNSGLLGAVGAAENLANNMSASAVNDAFNLIGIDIANAGRSLTTGIQNVADNFGADVGLTEGLGDLTGLGDKIVPLTISVVALTTAVGALTAVMTGRGILSLGRRGIAGLFGRGAAAAGTAAAGTGAAAAGTAAAGTGAAAARSSGILRTILGKATVPLTLGIGAYQAGSALMDDELSTTEKSAEVGSGLGLAGGALAGAAIGSVIPGFGTAIGGIVGGIVGGLGGSMLGNEVGTYVGENFLAEDLQGDISETNTEIQNLQSRIQRSLEGQNEYFGRENRGRESSAEEILALQANLEQLRDNAAEIIGTVQNVEANFSRLDLYSADRELFNEYDNRVREIQRSGEGLTELQAQLQASGEFADRINETLGQGTVTVTQENVVRDQAAVDSLTAAISSNVESVLMANQILNPTETADTTTAPYNDAILRHLDSTPTSTKPTTPETISVQATPTELTESEIASLRSQKSELINELDTYVFDQNDNPRPLDEDGRLVGISNKQHERLEEINRQLDIIGDKLEPYQPMPEINYPNAPTPEIVEPTPEPVSPAPAIQSSTILGQYDKLYRNATQAEDELEKFKASAGEQVQIGFDQQMEDFVGDGRIFGYADAEKQAKYKELSSQAQKSDRSLSKLEKSTRYQFARARELADEMGLETGDSLEMQTRGHVPTSINGVKVDQDLFNEREKEKLAISDSLRDAMSERPAVREPDAEPEEPQKTQTSAVQDTSRPVTPMTQDQGDLLISEIRENNRLLRRQTDTIESTA